MSLPPSHISITTLTPPPSETGSNVNHQTGPYFGHRLFLLSLAFSLVAVCACALLIPLLIAELDDLTTFAREEGKVFKGMADEIWTELMSLQKRPFPASTVISLGKRLKKELPMAGLTESKNLLDRLERKSYKGRQRLQRKQSSVDEHLMSDEGRHQWQWEGVPPRARAWSFNTLQLPSAATGPEELRPELRKPLTGDGQQHPPAVRPIQQQQVPPSAAPTGGNEGSGFMSRTCPRGPTGTPGIAGIDGVPGLDGIPGKAGLSGAELQKTFEKADGCIKCPAGLPGVSGPPGSPGIPGERGSPGVPGIAKKARPGPPGPIGEPGLDGVDGANGVDGIPGVPGIKYARGIPGPKGEVGPPGEPGIPGEHGQEGLVGKPGEAGWPGWPGPIGPEGAAGLVGPVGDSGIPGIESHYCNCPVRTSQLAKLKDLPGGLDAYLGRWKGRLPNQLLEDYEKFVEEKAAELRIKPPLIEVQN